MANKAKILVVDDEISIVEVLKALLSREGYEVDTSSDGEEALDLLREDKFDLMISDIRMQPMDGITLLREARALQAHLAIIMITAYATVETAVDAMKNGAFDYVCKPFKIDELLLTVQRALSYEHALQENETLKESLRAKYHFENLVGDHDNMRNVYALIEKVARTDSTILIRGESGTGKELVARALHNYSRRNEKPFVAINCAALPETLLESELFGYVKGAFTGANKFKKGLFEAAEGGTLLLDEIGSLPVDMQTKLLRVLEEREFRPVGGTKTVSVDVRIVAATNEPLEERIKTSQFREDLYYRLSVIPIELPPLRDRISDVPLLVNHFLKELNEAEGRTITIDSVAVKALQLYAWPGNVRELENVVRRAGTLCDGNRITLQDLPPKIIELARQNDLRDDEEDVAKLRGVSLKSFLRAKEREYIQLVLDQCGGDKEQAASALGISLATFYRKNGRRLKLRHTRPPNAAQPKRIAMTRREHNWTVRIRFSARMAAVLTACTALLSLGCQATRWNLSGRGRTKTAEPIFTLALHPIEPGGSPGGRLVTQVSSPRGVPIIIRRIPLLTSHRIVGASVVADETGGQGLRILLDPRGHYRWMQMAAQYRGHDVAVLIDGRYRFQWRVAGPGDADGSVLIRGDWNSLDLEQVARHAHTNYQLLNTD